MKVLESLNIFFWLDFGTLLGAVRDKSITDWDHDFDFSVWDIDREKLLLAKNILISKGYKVIIEKNLPWFEGIMQIYIPRNNLDKDSKGRLIKGIDHIDINVYTKINDEACIRMINEPSNSKSTGVIAYQLFRMLNKLDPKYSDNRRSGLKKKTILSLVDLLPNDVKRFVSFLAWKVYLYNGESSWLISPTQLLSEFTTITLYGIDFKIPKEYEKYLEYWYSPKWRIPDGSWDVTHNGGRCIKKVRNSYITDIPVQPVQNSDKYLWEE